MLLPRAMGGKRLSFGVRNYHAGQFRPTLRPRYNPFCACLLLCPVGASPPNGATHEASKSWEGLVRRLSRPIQSVFAVRDQSSYVSRARSVATHSRVQNEAAHAAPADL